ncbi:MAG: sporulation protein YqfD [Clostridiales bacterium]|nr:sporulation protein YqfD [Clostridiales bacterium]
MKNKSAVKPQTADKASKKVEAERLRNAQKAEAARLRKAKKAKTEMQKSEAERLRRAKKVESDEQKRQIAARRKAEKRERMRAKEIVRQEKAKLAAERQKKRAVLYSKIRVKLKNNSAGFERKQYGLIPRVELAVKGDKTSVITRLAAADIKVTDVRFSGGETLFKIRKKDLRKAVAILSEMCYTHRINAAYGVAQRLAFCLARIGLVAGAALSVIGMNISYGYIWQVQITGNDKLSVAAIESKLRRDGIAVGCKKSGGITDKAAAVLGGMDGVSDASCEIIGTTLYVHVLESTDSTALTRYGEYVSEYDATVTRIVMRSGTAKVKRGDAVKRGDVLANGDAYSTTGELLYTGDCDCDIYGKVAITVTAQIPVTAVEYRPTGRTAVKTVYTLFGKSFGGNKPPYRTYELSSHASRYDVLIPLYVTAYEYRETKAVEYERDVEQAAEDFAKAKIESMRFEGEFDYSYNIEQAVSGLYSVHLFITGETVISRGRSPDRQDNTEQ